MIGLGGKAAIVGIGATEFSRNSKRSEMQLAVEAVISSLADAGLTPQDVDGLSTFTFDTNSETEVFRNIGGRALKFFSRINYGGGGACAILQQAAMAVATGVAEVVVCYRALNANSEHGYGQPMDAESLGAGGASSESLFNGYTMHQGLQTAAANFGMIMRRYMYEAGATSDDFANIALADRRHAATNPKAFFYQKPLTREAYHASKMIADPFRLYDCCLVTDGAVAVVVTSAERARDLRQRSVLIKGAAQSAPLGTGMASSFFDPEADLSPRGASALLASQLYRQAGVGPEDIDVAILYDHFAPMLMPIIEGLGFCGKGEAKDFIKNGNIEIGGQLPVNTNGGQLGEGYIHGVNGIAEAVRQIRGSAINQVPDASHVIVTAGTGCPTSAVILGAA